MRAIFRLMKHFIQYNAVLLAFFFSIASGSDVGAAVFGGIIHETPKKIIKAGGKPLKVIDGDSFFIGKTEIRLEGIDAPEYFQECYDAEDNPYPCGKKAKKALEKLVSSNIRCEKITRDKYRRVVAICHNGKLNINREMVAQGQAVAYKRYTHEFDDAEKSARRLKKGIWQGRFLKPEFYRILKKQKKNQK